MLQSLSQGHGTVENFRVWLSQEMQNEVRKRYSLLLIGEGTGEGRGEVGGKEEGTREVVRILIFTYLTSL